MEMSVSFIRWWLAGIIFLSLTQGGPIVATTTTTADTTAAPTTTTTTEAATTPTTPTNHRQVGLSNTRFSWDLYNKIAQEAGSQNIVFSPLSVITALSMVYLGAKYNTAEEMAKVLHYQGLNNVHIINRQFLGALRDPGNNYTLDVANGVFASNRFTIEDKYISDIKKFYNADFQYLDFAANLDNSTDLINDWIQVQTRDRMMGYYYEGATDRHSVLVLINIVYFKGWWMFDFDPEKTHSGQFRINYEQMQEMEFMFQERRAYYWKDRILDCRILEIPYAGNEVDLYIILPNDVHGIHKLEKNLNSSILDKVMTRENRLSGMLKIYMPKFEMDVNINLRGILFKMGIKDLFLDRADLRGIGPNVAVTDVTHKATLEVTEEGTIGTAVSGIQISLSGPIPDNEFRIDHPFIFFIKEKVTDNILFVGRMMKSPIPGEVIGTFDPDLLTNSSMHIMNSFVLSIIFPLFWYCFKCFDKSIP